MAVVQVAHASRTPLDPSGDDCTVSEQSLPQVPFGPYRISRLILGDNPIHGGSHLSRFVNEQMRRYFSREQVLRLLTACEAEGINTWQSNPPLLDLYLQRRREGSGLQFISLGRQDPKNPDAVARLAQADAIGIAHHGEATDALFKDGRIGEVRDFLRNVHDAGLLAGVSTHMPAVVDHLESHGWDIDFYMTCVYERHRSTEQLRALLGHVPIPVGEVYLEDDPPRMFAAMRNTAKPCLAFKILAAGRLSDAQPAVEQAFRETFRQIKPTDAVIVGLYPEYEDQVALNAGYVRRFSALSGAE